MHEVYYLKKMSR